MMCCFLEGDSSGEEGKSYIFLSRHHFFLMTYTILQSNTDVKVVLGVSEKPPKFY